MYNALAYNYYYLGEEDESHYYWDKLKQISKVEVDMLLGVVKK